MAAREKGYGLTAECQDKIASKWDKTLANEATDWIGKLTGTTVGSDTMDIMWEELKDGTVLCALINALKSGSIKRVNNSKMAFKMMENIGNFLTSCEVYGMKKGDLFQTVDLFECQNMPQVVNSIHALGRLAQKKDFNGPTLGPKESDANVRQFSETQLKEGQHVIGLQMGSNKGASQAGATPYGLGRQIEKTNLNI